MAKANMIDTIGKLFIDDDFRASFNRNAEGALQKSEGLTEKEKQFLIDNANVLKECTDRLFLCYSDDGTDKRH